MVRQEITKRYKNDTLDISEYNKLHPLLQTKIIEYMTVKDFKLISFKF